MATKVTIIGEKPKTKSKKRIQFLKYLTSDGINFDNLLIDPSNFKNIELICRNYTRDGEDLMFAYDSDRNSGMESFLIIGHFNDGIV